MLIGVLNIAVGIVFTCVGLHYNMYSIAQGSFWLGSVVRLGSHFDPFYVSKSCSAVHVKKYHSFYMFKI